jgi:hypothetical protein
MFIYNGVHIFYFYIMYYPFYIFVLQGPGSVNELISYARGLARGSIRGSSFGWSHHLVVGLRRWPTGRTVRLMDFIADQLVGLLGAHFYSTLTSPPRSVRWTARCSFHRRPVSQIAHRMGFIVSYVGGLPAMLGLLDVRILCAKVAISWGLPWRSNFATSRRSFQICWFGSEPCCRDLGVPRCGWYGVSDEETAHPNPYDRLSRLPYSDRIKAARSVIARSSAKHSTSLISENILNYFLWPCYKIFLHLLAGSGTKSVHFTLRWVCYFTASQLSWGLAMWSASIWSLLRWWHRGYRVFSDKLAIGIWPLEVLFSCDFFGEPLDDSGALIFPIDAKHYRCRCSYTQGYTPMNAIIHTLPLWAPSNDWTRPTNLKIPKVTIGSSLLMGMSPTKE